MSVMVDDETGDRGELDSAENRFRNRYWYINIVSFFCVCKTKKGFGLNKTEVLGWS